MTLKSFKAGDLIYSDIPLLQAKGFSLLWKTDSSNQIMRIYQIYKDKLRNSTKRAIFDEITLAGSDQNLSNLAMAWDYFLNAD